MKKWRKLSFKYQIRTLFVLLILASSIKSWTKVCDEKFCWHHVNIAPYMQDGFKFSVNYNQKRKTIQNEVNFASSFFMQMHLLSFSLIAL